MPHPSMQILAIHKMQSDQTSPASDFVATEEPLEILMEFGSEFQREKRKISVTMRTPGHDRELVAGFLFNEGIVRSVKEIRDIHQSISNPNQVMVELEDHASPQLQRAARNFYSNSGCGVCGKLQMEDINIQPVFKLAEDSISIMPGLLYGLPDIVKSRQEIFDSTGGLHASALFDIMGRLQIIREDVGRHNAVDKLIGVAFLDHILPLSEHILFLSGRAGFELIQKAVMAGIRIVAAIGAPSSLAVKVARENKVTLLGFLRGERFNIYSGMERIMHSAAIVSGPEISAS